MAGRTRTDILVGSEEEEEEEEEDGAAAAEWDISAFGTAPAEGKGTVLEKLG